MGNCWDDACSETLFGSLKVERLHGQRFETIRQAKDETIAWLPRFNQNTNALNAELRQPDPVRTRLEGS
jgi:putative transposase